MPAQEEENDKKELREKKEKETTVVVVLQHAKTTLIEDHPLSESGPVFLKMSSHPHPTA
jgi:hypothetical protein